MSCYPGNPCYGAYYQPQASCATTYCVTTADRVIYNGPNLPGSGIQSGQNLDCALSLLDDAILQLKLAVFTTTSTTTTLP